MTVLTTGDLAEAPARPPEERGRTELAERVVERIAQQVVLEAEHASGAARRLVGMALGSDEDTEAPQVTVTIDGQLAIVQLTMSVAYPMPVRQVTRQVRQDMIERIGALTGLEVRHVDISICRLTGAGFERRVR
jgi:uncharacterized alkaline shock family protein YloU